MKKLIIFMCFLSISLSAQTSLNPNLLLGYDFSSTFIDKDYFKNNILRGWNFGNSDTYTHKLDNALNINQ